MLRPLFTPSFVSVMLLASLAGQAQSSSVNVSRALAGETLVSQASGTTPQKEQAAARLGAASPTVSLTDPVLKVDGVCSSSVGNSRAGAEACVTIVTRKEFDELMDIVAPGKKVDGSTRQNVAKMYAELLAFETAAAKAGIPDTPEFRWTLQLLRLRTLADSYRHNLDKQYGAPSSEEIDDYYHHEVRRFEEVKLGRIVLPKNNFSAANREEFEKRAVQIANELRQRAANGEDLDGLQKDAYRTLGFPGLPPATDAGNHRRNSLLPEVADEIFGLVPGQVTKVENEPYSFVIYKVEAKRTIPEQMVVDEISRELTRQKVESAVKAVTESVHTDLNQVYFGTGQSNLVQPVAGSPR